MRAIVVEQFGGPEVLKSAEVPAPEPGAGQVSIDVAYAGINSADLKARSVGYWVDSLPFRPGLEVSGRIREVGAGVEESTDRQSLATLTPCGRLVSFGNSGGETPWQAGPTDLYPGRSVAGFSIRTLAKVAPQELRTLAAMAFALVADGALDPLISAELPLTDAPEAHRLVETRTTTGKLLLRVAGD